MSIEKLPLLITRRNVGTAKAKAADARRDVLAYFMAEQKWSFEEKMSALVASIFHTPREQRTPVIGWVEELLIDLKDTRL